MDLQENKTEKKLKVGIVTFHFASNRGAVLQCFALKKFLEGQGCKVKIIDYQPAYHKVQYDVWKNPITFAKRCWKNSMHDPFFIRCGYVSKRTVKCLISNLKRTDAQIKSRFDSFRHKHFEMTERYSSVKKLKANPPELDAYISGSDQVWNPRITDQKFDEAYFIKFGSENAIKIAYAVSIGEEHTAERLAELSELCKDFTAISFRENSVNSIRATNRAVHICIDPTLLLDSEDYLEAESQNTIEEPYIFVFGFETNEDIQNAVATAKNKYNCKIINGSPNHIKLTESVEIMDGYGPDEFLTLIKNAKSVVTNSFHGTVFSLIYKKDFITVCHTARASRMTELLEKLEIPYRLWNNREFSFERQIDYAKVDSLLEKLRDDSKRFLIEGLNGKTGEEIFL